MYKCLTRRMYSAVSSAVTLRYLFLADNDGSSVNK